LGAAEKALQMGRSTNPAAIIATRGHLSIGFPAPLQTK
jgi:hypothetical protein